MAEAPAPPPTPSSASAAPAHSTSKPSSSAAAPRQLPPTLFLPPSARAVARRAPGRSRRGKKVKVPASSADRLTEAVRVVGRDLGGEQVAGADILELAMAKGPMFSWLSYWPEEGYPKEDHPY